MNGKVYFVQFLLFGQNKIIICQIFANDKEKKEGEIYQMSKH